MSSAQPEAGLTAADDCFHRPATHNRWWTETAMFSADVADARLSACVYPLFRPNLGVCLLGVYVWDSTGRETRDALYSVARWHLAMPTSDLDDLWLEGLHYRVIEPLRVYEVTYTDGDRLTLDLRYEACREPHIGGLRSGRGHIDQPCFVRGEIRLENRRVNVESIAMRDRSWFDRPDDAPLRTAYAWGFASGDEQFLHITQWRHGGYDVRNGFLVRDGRYARLVSGERRVRERQDGHPMLIELEGCDELGRRFEATGRCRNRIGQQSSPGIFSWLSQTEWTGGSGSFTGEDQEAWSKDQIDAARGSTGW